MRKALILVFIVILLQGLLGCEAEMSADEKEELTPPVGDTNISAEEEMVSSLVMSINPNQSISVSEFLQLYPSAQKRLTHDGCYYFCPSTDDGGLFAFSQDGMNIYKVRYYEKFYSEKDFSFIEIGKTTYSDVVCFDSNFETWDVSFVPCAAYYTTEGAVIIHFSSYPGKSASEYLVDRVEYISNDEWSIVKEYESFLDLPYICGEDKTRN